jgi:DNA-binding XRE family transcriptional regulator
MKVLTAFPEQDDMEDTQTRGQRLRATRKHLQWTQAELGQFLDIGQTTVHRAEYDDPTIPVVFWFAFHSFCNFVDKGGIRSKDLNEGPTHHQVGIAPTADNASHHKGKPE